jgi:hypothetical protein
MPTPPSHIPSLRISKSSKNNSKSKSNGSKRKSSKLKTKTSRSLTKRKCPSGTSRDKASRKCVPSHSKTAIIIPFRDTTPDNVRTKQLSTFIQYMTTFFKENNDYKIFVIEQSTDNRKFNRGKLLNIGFKIAESEGFNLFLFHDVDLLPSKELYKWYTTKNANPVHVASVWKRYNYEGYFGGVVSFPANLFKLINGFPNNLWGWGGEDDELGTRVREMGLHIVKPTSGSFRDLENKNGRIKTTKSKMYEQI